MTDKAWPSEGVESILFIVDADHQVEESLLHEYIEKIVAENDYHGTYQRAIVSIAHSPEDISVDKLQLKLDTSDDTLLVPLRVFWNTKYGKLDGKLRLKDLLMGNSRRPSRFAAKRILNSDPSRAICFAAKPATLGELTSLYTARQKLSQADKSLADFIAGRAALALEVSERRFKGSRYRVPRQVAKQIRTTEAYRRGVLEIAVESGETEQQLRTRAIPIFKELVSIPHNFWQDVMASMNRKIISLGYEKEVVIDQKRLLRFRQIVRENPSAMLWTHKTHMDGLTISSILFENDFPTPHTVGGINMAFAGLGFVAKRAGAIFIRRSFQDNPLYKLVMRRYLAYLLEKHFPLTWAFEGTRSRVGKLMPPRYGILKYVMDAISDSNAEKLYILPVAINYDMINDVKDYAAEQSGAIKRPESLSWAISYIRRIRQPLGRIYVDFGEPVVISRETAGNDGLALAKTAFRVGVEANRVTPITLTSLMSMLLLGAAPRALTIEELRAGVDDLRSWATHRSIRLTSDFDDDNVEHMRELVEAMVKNQLINRYDEGPEIVFAVAADQHAQAGYYRNTIVHHFVPKSIAELALLHASLQNEDPMNAFWTEAQRLRDMFKFEFFYAPSEEFNDEIRAELDIVDPQWQSKMADSPTFALELLRKMTPLVAHSTLRPYIEGYRITADVLASIDGNATIDQKAMVQASFKYGRQAYLQRRIGSKASIGKILFENGHKLLKSYGLLEANAVRLEARKKASRDFRILTHRIEHIRTLALPSDLD